MWAICSYARRIWSPSRLDGMHVPVVALREILMPGALQIVAQRVRGVARAAVSREGVCLEEEEAKRRLIPVAARHEQHERCAQHTQLDLSRRHSMLV